MMRALVPIVCNQAVTLLLGIVGLKLISKFVPPDVNGAYRLFLTLTQISSLITHSGLINHATRYWQRERPNAAAYARFLRTRTWRGLGFLAPLLTIVTLMVAASDGDARWIWVLPLLVMSNVASAFVSIATGALNADGSLWRVFWLSAIGGAARIVLPIALGLAAGMTFFNLSAGFTLHGVILIVSIFLLMRHAFASANTPPSNPARWLHELREYGRPFLWLGVGGWLLQSADAWVVKHFFSIEQTGFFTYASGIGAIIPTVVAGGLMQLVFPKIFRKADAARTMSDWNGLARSCDQITLVFLALTVGGILILDGLAPRVVGVLIDPQYVPSLEMLIPAGFAMVTVQSNQFYYLLLQGQRNSAGMVKVMLVVSGLKTAGSIIAASVSWPVYSVWLIASLPISGLLGRHLVRRIALRTDLTSENQ